MTLDELCVILRMLNVETEYLRPFGKDKNQVQIACPLAPYLHESREDRHPSLSIKFGNPTEWTVFKCWCCKEQGNLWQLVDSYAELTDNDELRKLVNQLIESDKPTLASRLALLSTGFDSYVKPKVAPPDVYPNHILDRMKPVQYSFRAIEYLRSRSISLEVCEVFDVRYDDKLDRIVFPVRNNLNQLVGAVGRAVDSGAPKRYHNYFVFTAGRTLGGIDKLTAVNSKLLVVEGFFDVLNAYQHVYPLGYDVVCTWRAEMSEEQASYIASLIDKLPIICYDMDSAGCKGHAKAIEYLSSHVPYLKRAKWDDVNLDFGSMSLEQLSNVLSSVSPVF